MITFKNIDKIMVTNNESLLEQVKQVTENDDIKLIQISKGNWLVYNNKEDLVTGSVEALKDSFIYQKKAKNEPLSKYKEIIDNFNS